MTLSGRPDGPARHERFEFRPVAAVLYREWRVFRRVWFSTAFGSILEPVIYFVAFGYGFGALVARVAGLSYLEFVATGTVAIGILFSSMFPGLINGYFRRKEQRLYDGLLSAPVSVPELVTGEALWNGLRVTAVSLATMVVAVLFGIRPGPGVVLVAPISVVAGFGFAAAGAAFASRLASVHSFDFVIVGIIAPMYVMAGTFFPLDELPDWVATVGRINPLYHVVELLRGASFGFDGIVDPLGHLAAVVVFDVVAWLAAILLVRAALID